MDKEFLEIAERTETDINTLIHPAHHRLADPNIPGRDIGAGQLEAEVLGHYVNWLGGNIQTFLGDAMAVNMMLEPLPPYKVAFHREEAIDELVHDDQAYWAAWRMLHEVSERQSNLHHLIADQLNRDDPYPMFKEATRLLADLPELAQREKLTPHSPLMQRIVEDIADFRGSRSWELARGPIYRHIGAIKTRSEIPFISLTAQRFRPNNPIILHQLGLTAGVVLSSAGLASTLNGAEPTLPAIQMLGGLISVALGSLGISGKETRDHRNYLTPLSQELRQDPSILMALRSIGKLDVLRASAQGIREGNGLVNLPTLNEEDVTRFDARDLRRPDLGSAAMGSHISLGEKIMVISGPERTGKTSAAMAILAAQHAGSRGLPIHGSQAELGRIRGSMVIQANALDESEHNYADVVTSRLRYAVQVAQSYGNKSLIILDDFFSENNPKVMPGLISFVQALKETGAGVVMTTRNVTLAETLGAADIADNYHPAILPNGQPAYALQKGPGQWRALRNPLED